MTALSLFPPAEDLPHSYEAEQGLLGAILTNNRAIERVPPEFRAEHFADPLHTRIYETLRRTIDRGELANPVTLRRMFEGDDAAPGLPVGQYMVKLAGSVVAIVNAEDYARTITDLWARRATVLACREIIAGATDPESSGEAVLEAAESRIRDIGSGARIGRRDLVPFGDGLDGALSQVEAAWKAGGVSGLSTGLKDLDERTAGLHPGSLVIVGGRPGMGKAQPLDSLVQTPGGPKLMGDIVVGDRVLSPTGEPSVVTGVFPQGIQQTLILTFYDGRRVECSVDHLWEVRSRHWAKPRVLTAANIDELLQRVRHQKRLQVALASGEGGAPVPHPLPPYILGVLLGDGSTGKGAYFTSADGGILQSLAHRMPQGWSISQYPGLEYGIVGRDAQGRCCRDTLKSIGIFGCRSWEKHIHPDYLVGSKADRLELLRGLLDTDGTVEPSGTIRFCTVSEALARDVAALVWSLGGVCRTSTRKPRFNGSDGKKKDGRPAWVLTIRHPNPRSLFTLQRKIDRIPRGGIMDNRPLRLTIIGIERGREVECQCIKVSHPSGLYLTDGHVVTHNSDVALNIAFTAAEAGKRVGFFSLEMSTGLLTNRLLARATGIPATNQIAGRVSEAEIAALSAAAGRLRDIPLWIDDSAASTVDAIGARARRLQRRHGLDLLVVDYLQLIAPGNSRRRRETNRTEDVTMISQGLKGLAKDLGVPVLALCQLSRAVESREDKRPQLADLRESGAIEQDADVVIFVYRESYYLDRDEPKQRQNETTEHFTERRAEHERKALSAMNMAEAIIAKQRMGSAGTVNLYYRPAHSHFADLHWRDER